MQGSVPIVRNLSAIAGHTNSRIPHLNFHILQRRAQNAALRPTYVSSIAQQQRGQSSSISVSDFKNSDTVSSYRNIVAEQSKPYGTPASVATASNGVVVQEAESERVEDVNFYTILEKNSPDLVLLALSNENIGEPFVRDAPDETFNKALLMLDPEYFVNPYKGMYRYMHLREDELADTRGLRQIEDRFLFYTDLLQKIIDLRHEGKHKLTLVASTHLLKWAASLGHESLAVRIFDEVMKDDGILPDVDCYNYYMEALNWSNAYTQAEKFSLRVLPLHLKIRGLLIRPAGFSGYRAENTRAENVGIRGEILETFKQLVESGQKANAHTFINMMNAMGREGDLSGVASILKSVWNVDLAMMNKYDEDEIESPTFYEEGHPLRPTEDLLFAIAHIFGSNNDARTAWTLVDYVSRNYAIPLPRHVWTELLEWYMVLCLRRGSSSARKGYASGKIPHDVFEQLFSSMVDQPHNLQPDCSAYYLQSRVRLDKRNLEEQIEAINGLCTNLEQSTQQVRKSMQDLTQWISSTSGKQLHHLWNQPLFLRLRRKFIMDSLDFEACLGMTRHAIAQRLLRHNYWPGSRKLTEWERRRLPQLVDQFAIYLPQTLNYRTASGTVELRDPNRSKDDAGSLFAKNYKRVIQLRKALDTDDHDVLLQGLIQIKNHSKIKDQKSSKSGKQ